MLNEKMIIFQQPDPDRGNKLCDIEEEDEIEDKSEINVLLIPAVNMSELTDSSSSVCDKNSPIVKVLYTVPMNDSENNVLDLQNSACCLVSYNKYFMNVIDYCSFILRMHLNFVGKFQ